MARTKKEVEEYVWDILVNMSNRDWMAYATEYMDELIDEGVYDKFLLEAYTGCSLNYRNWDIHELQWMFEMAERDKLLKAGDPLTVCFTARNNCCWTSAMNCVLPSPA